jgi:hypothetical protein
MTELVHSGKPLTRVVLTNEAGGLKQFSQTSK